MPGQNGHFYDGQENSCNHCEGRIFLRVIIDGKNLLIIEE